MKTNYCRKSLRAGDYTGSGNREGLYKNILANVSRCQNDEDRWHARGEISYALACQSISSEQGDSLFLAAGLTKDGGLK